jgi:hypothetical protein
MVTWASINIDHVGKTICHKPSPSHHHQYMWYVAIPSHGWFMIVLPTFVDFVVMMM